MIRPRDADTGCYLGLEDDASLVVDRTVLKSWFINETFQPGVARTAGAVRPGLPSGGQRL
ncbi:hypothetical protein [Streptomyces sp. NPDC020480]|uniref:hypothetical protein n=1 Tax=Streptomyces sp. NPDC020480 TaxID=3365076 RepID=UPI0037AE698F